MTVILIMSLGLKSRGDGSISMVTVSSATNVQYMGIYGVLEDYYSN